MKHLFFLLLLAAAVSAAQVQQPAAPAPQQPIELKPGRMQPQAHPAANRSDRPPQFPGGPEALGAFFQENVKYPEAARVKQLTGNVEVTATVQADGRLANPTVAKSLSAECDAEALRVVGLLPAWQPATRKGQPIPVQVRLPVPFGNAAVLQVK